MGDSSCNYSWIDQSISLLQLLHRLKSSVSKDSCLCFPKQDIYLFIYFATSYQQKILVPIVSITLAATSGSSCVFTNSFSLAFPHLCYHMINRPPHTTAGGWRSRWEECFFLLWTRSTSSSSDFLLPPLSQWHQSLAACITLTTRGTAYSIGPVLFNRLDGLKNRLWCLFHCFLPQFVLQMFWLSNVLIFVFIILASHQISCIDITQNNKI